MKSHQTFEEKKQQIESNNDNIIPDLTLADLKAVTIKYLLINILAPLPADNELRISLNKLLQEALREPAASFPHVKIKELLNLTKATSYPALVLLLSCFRYPLNEVPANFLIGLSDQCLKKDLLPCFKDPQDYANFKFKLKKLGAKNGDEGLACYVMVNTARLKYFSDADLHEHYLQLFLKSNPTSKGLKICKAIACAVDAESIIQFGGDLEEAKHLLNTAIALDRGKYSRAYELLGTIYFFA